MTEQNPSPMPATDDAPATEYPVVAGAGESFDALDSTTPLSADGADKNDDGPTAGAADRAAEPSEG